MPVGVIIDSLCVLAGGLVGRAAARIVPSRLKTSLITLFGFVAVTMGIMKIVKGTNLTAVTLSVVLGGILGEWIDIDRWLRRGAQRISARFAKADDEATGLIVMAVVAFCASGTGIFGAMEEGFAGDASVLLSKAGLDFFTAVIFSTVAGRVIAWISVPQFALLLGVFFVGGLLAPHMSSGMRDTFLAVGGVITLMNGCGMANISPIRAANVIPALLVALCFG